jgi:hypothetical protein
VTGFFRIGHALAALIWDVSVGPRLPRGYSYTLLTFNSRSHLIWDDFRPTYFDAKIKKLAKQD